MTFSRLDNLSRHIKSKQSQNKFPNHAVSKLPAVTTVCGRTIVLSKELFSPFTSIQSTNEKWISTTTEDVRNMFQQFKKVDETLDPYLHLFKLLIVNTKDEDVIDVIVSYIQETVGNEQKNSNDNVDVIFNGNEKGLVFFLEVCMKWLQYYSREHVNALNGKVRFRIQSFFDESALINPGFRVNFTMREKEKTLAKELELIVRLSWRLFHHQRMNLELWNQFDILMKHINVIRIKNNNIVSMEVVQEMMKKLIVQQFFYFIFVEPQKNAYSLLFGVNIFIARLFKLKKETAKNTNNANDKITMRSCAEFGSVIGTQIHLYRLAICSLLACTESNTSWEYIIQRTTKSCLCHVMSPILNKVSVQSTFILFLCSKMIKKVNIYFLICTHHVYHQKVKQMHSNKISTRKKEIKPNGDIIIDDYYFHKCNWSQLVPKLCSKFEDTLTDILVGDSWKCLVSSSNYINVKRVEDKELNEMHDLLHYKFFVIVNGKWIDETKLVLKPSIDDTLIERLSALVMISLHGLGKLKYLVFPFI